MFPTNGAASIKALCQRKQDGATGQSDQGRVRDKASEVAWGQIHKSMAGILKRNEMSTI